MVFLGHRVSAEAVLYIIFKRILGFVSIPPKWRINVFYLYFDDLYCVVIFQIIENLKRNTLKKPFIKVYENPKQLMQPTIYMARFRKDMHLTWQQTSPQCGLDCVLAKINLHTLADSEQKQNTFGIRKQLIQHLNPFPKEVYP